MATCAALIVRTSLASAARSNSAQYLPLLPLNCSAQLADANQFELTGRRNSDLMRSVDLLKFETGIPGLPNQELHTTGCTDWVLDSVDQCWATAVPIPM